MTLEDAKAQMVDYFRMMYHSGMVNLFEGNISMRWADRYLITPSQQNKETMTSDMILEIDENGKVLNGKDGMKPSSEFKMHMEVYRLRPDVQVCVHNHSLCATAFAVAGKPIISEGIAESNLVFGQVPVAGYGRMGTADIYREFEKYLKEYNAILLENHGVLTVGRDMTYAFSYAEAVEKMAKILLIARILGGEKSLPKEELETLREYGKQLRIMAMDI